MKNTLLSIFFLSFILLVSSPNAYASYGGGGGFPGGFSSRVKFVCHGRRVNFGFIRLTLPICKLERVDTGESDVQDRLENFFERVENGGS